MVVTVNSALEMSPVFVIVRVLVFTTSPRSRSVRASLFEERKRVSRVGLISSVLKLYEGKSFLFNSHELEIKKYATPTI
jgi:hypothetical protein